MVVSGRVRVLVRSGFTRVANTCVCSFGKHIENMWMVMVSLMYEVVLWVPFFGSGVEWKRRLAIRDTPVSPQPRGQQQRNPKPLERIKGQIEKQIVHIPVPRIQQETKPSEQARGKKEASSEQQARSKAPLHSSYVIRWVALNLERYF